MEQLFKEVFMIIELLEQIKTLTNNQTTVLLVEMDIAEENERLDIIEQMANYKDGLMRELKEQEIAFQETYTIYKKQLEESGRIAEIQELVGRVLQLQQKIVELEKGNLLLMQNRSKIKDKKVDILVNSAKAVSAYQKQKIKT